METLLSGVERAASRFASLNGLIDKVASRMLPQRSARAYSCSWSYCYMTCNQFGYKTVNFHWTDCVSGRCYSGCGGPGCQQGTWERC